MFMFLKVMIHLVDIVSFLFLAYLNWELFKLDNKEVNSQSELSEVSLIIILKLIRHHSSVTLGGNS